MKGFRVFFVFFWLFEVDSCQRERVVTVSKLAMVLLALPCCPGLEELPSTLLHPGFHRKHAWSEDAAVRRQAHLGYPSIGRRPKKRNSEGLGVK